MNIDTELCFCNVDYTLNNKVIYDLFENKFIFPSIVLQMSPIVVSEVTVNVDSESAKGIRGK